MDSLLHFVYFALGAAVIWFFSGLLVDAVDRVAKRFHQSGFTVAFFVLGLMTSISEISVMINATLNKTPQVSAGNLSGASFVILILIVPLLAIVSNGISLNGYIRKFNFALALAVIALPALFLADGQVTLAEGLLALLAYIMLLYFIRKMQPSAGQLVQEVEQELIQKKYTTARDIMIIIGGALAILLAGHTLVEESVYFANMLHIPASIIGLLILSLGTNVPEIVVAVRSVRKNHTDIAFGDYMGSAVANTLIFGVLSVLNGTFNVEATQFLYIFLFMSLSFTLLFIFGESKNKLSRKEGIILLSIYLLFIFIEIFNVVQGLH